MATIEKRGASYRITASCGYDVDGTQERPRTTWKPEAGMTEKQIEKELNRQAVLFEEECKKGFVTKSLKFETFVKDEYFENYAPENLKARTIDSYQHMEQRVYAEIGHIKMDKIAPIHIQKFARQLIKGDAKHKPLSPKSAKNYLAFISSVFAYATQMRVVKENPCRAVKIALKSRPEHDCYTLEEAQHFLDLLSKESLFYRVFFTLAIYGGFRRGELLGLEWKDINFDKNIISIQRESLYTKEKGIFTDTTKTKSSQRSLKLPAEVMALVKSYRAEQSMQRLKCGDQWIDVDRLFVSWNGSPLYPSAPYNWLDRFCKRTGMRKTKSAIHGFRHLNATLLITNHADVKTVSAALGHSQPSTTLNIYTHTFQVAQAEASEAIANALPLKSHA
ncbi:MAG: integrase family protein [Caproiciproducens sp.]|nr:integrase family protein [Caproiciproducens sp.]